MKLNLTKPLVVFDLETTGLDLVNDRIIQISFIKVLPDGKEERENIFINPEKPIPTEVTQLTESKGTCRQIRRLRFRRFQFQPF